jgi:hypothetical protein
MSLLSKVAVPVLMVLLVLSLAACDREITRVEQIGEAQTCFECHSDQNTFLIAAEAQWANSFHASGLRLAEGESATCAACHISEGFIQRVNGETVTANTNPTVIHCFTCHSPHTDGDFGLRWTETATLFNGVKFDLGAANLCVACHHARRDAKVYVGTVGTDRVKISSTHWGPHYSNQGDILIGSNGYEYSDYDYAITKHRSATTDGCLDCHYRVTSSNVIGGHSFNMKGFLRDEGGIVEELENTAACEKCHNDVESFDIAGVQTEVDEMAEHLAGLLEAAGLWANGGPKVTTTSVDSAGAVWNLAMAEDDRSHGVHNPAYVKGLLESSIQFMEGTLKPTLAAK